MSKATMFGKLKLGDRFTWRGMYGTCIYTKTGERESWSPNGRLFLFADTMVWIDAPTPLSKAEKE